MRVAPERYRMSTGEVVDLVFTRYYVTPRGDQPYHTLRVTERHELRSTVETASGAIVPTVTVLPKGGTYNLTPAELARNGERLQ